MPSGESGMRLNGKTAVITGGGQGIGKGIASRVELRRSGGAVINIASTRAYMSEPDTESYAASKATLWPSVWDRRCG